jgi:hypothetical protein
MSELLDKIHSKGYWRVNIRPTIFEIERIPNLTQCWNIIEECVVLLRGWDYPHIDRNKRVNREDFISSEVDFEGYIEYWQFHQSAQFIHHFSCVEDWVLDPSQLSPLSVPSRSPSDNYLSILSTLYKITEIFQFTSRLCSKQILNPSVELKIELYGMEDRQLFFWDPTRYLSLPKISQTERISLSRIYHPDDIITNAPQLAMDATIYIFERFGWERVSDQIFPEEQKKLLERRL